MSTKPLELVTDVPPSLTLAMRRLRTIADAARAYYAALPHIQADVKWARIRLSEGIPALTGDVLLDWQSLDSLVHVLIGLYEAGPNDSGSSAVRRDVDALVAELGQDQLLAATFAGAWDDLAQVRASEGPSVRQATLTLLDYATRPALHAAARDLRDILTETEWTRGTCPCCGALPTLAEIRSPKDEPSRVLRCGRCATAWGFARLACPACGEHDHNQLRYLHVDDEVEHRRAECCLTCGFYVKAVARLDPLDADALFDVDLETIALDSIALESGFHKRVD